MPIYPYVCRSCDYEFEKLQEIKDDPVVICPSCQKPKVERLIGRFNIGICETSFQRDFGSKGDYLEKCSDPIRRGELLAAAKRAGKSTYGKNWNPALATSMTDPDAWVGSMDDIQRVCKKRGWRYGVKDGNVDVGINSTDVGPFKKKQAKAK